MAFGQILKNLRTQKCLTQLQLAEMLNLSKANISKYEAGTVEPNIETLKMISNIFGVSVDYLLGKEKTAPKEQSLTSEQKKIAVATRGLSDDELNQVIDFVEFVKTKRKQ
ncbi:helix-turn-helix domain-containing protein [Anaerovorax sp. IOR16]|uniref:helix-turn-helix domain-containing protein n=1 Tax=Anaerovorax sp. IOR16 TaxID=2773458 RepID=UPI0019CFA5C1|nr:helix-turn-helix transcriptional regulator [Anaerovorax sp. IOR16]